VHGWLPVGPTGLAAVLFHLHPQSHEIEMAQAFQPLDRTGVILTRSLQNQPAQPDYQAWIGAPLTPVPSEYEALLQRLRRQLSLMAQAWNDTELLVRFIGPLLNLVDYWGPNYNFFLERKLVVRFNDRKLSGSVDGMVARGVDEPLQPFFFLA
jgi:hypothetical protein